jgi:tetratricopeptide (TPR) repeat protein
VTSAKIYLNHQKWAEARDVINEGLALDSNHVELYLMLGRVEAEMFEYAKADTAFKKAFELDITKAEEIEKIKQKFFRPLMRDGLTALKNNQPDSAEIFFKHVVALCPEKPEGYTNLGIICYDKKDFECAIDNFRKAKIRDPENESNIKNLALSFALANQPDSALVIYRELLVLNPGDFHTKNSIATILVNNAEFDEACTIYDSIVTDDVDDLNTLYNAGVAYFQDKQYDKSIANYERMIELAPDDPDALWNLSMAYFQVNDYKKSIPVLERLTETNSSNAEYWSFLSIAYTQINDGKKAEAADKKYKELTGEE